MKSSKKEGNENIGNCPWEAKKKKCQAIVHSACFHLDYVNTLISWWFLRSLKLVQLARNQNASDIQAREGKKKACLVGHPYAAKLISWWIWNGTWEQQGKERNFQHILMLWHFMCTWHGSAWAAYNFMLYRVSAEKRAYLHQIQPSITALYRAIAA